MKQGENQSAFPGWALPVVVLLVFGFVGIGGAVYHYQRLGEVAEPEVVVSDDRLKKVIQPNILFFSQIFLDRDQTFVSIPYRYDGEPQLVWLSFDTEANALPLSMLVDHHQREEFAEREMVELGENVRLYQRSRVYESADEFMSNPPQLGSLATDPHLLEYPILEGVEVEVISAETDLREFEFILSSYLPSRFEESENLYYYDNILDASGAFINEDNEITWHLTAPMATEENPIYIGNIHVDYRY